jgi:hypothetical protein
VASNYVAPYSWRSTKRRCMEIALIHLLMSSQISPSPTSRHALTSRWNMMLLLKVCRIVSQMRGCFIKVGIDHLKDFHSDNALVDILGNPCFWGAAWTCLKNTSMDIHKLPVLDFYFLSEYIQTSSGNLPMAHLHYLDWQSVTELQIGGAPTPLVQMEADLDRPPLTFLMVECQSFEHPLFMLINLPTHEALFITLRANEERDITQELWFQRIWKGVSNLYNWSKNLNAQPTILYSNWIEVGGFIEKRRNFPFIFYRILRSFPLTQSLSSTLLSPENGNGRKMVVESY